MDVTILAGPVRSGKTTRLAQWARGRWGVAGVLSPDGPEGRVFVDLATGATAAMEHSAGNEIVAAVGRFRFRQAAFDWANRRLMAAAVDAQAETVVVDEVGPLELAGEGLRAGVAAVLARANGRVMLVVRAPLVEAVVAALDIPQATVVTEIGW